MKFTLTKPESPIIANLGMDFATIQSAEYMAQMLKAGTPEQVDQNPIGTGPFVLDSYQKDDRIIYKANVDYLPRQAADRRSGLLDHAGPGDARSQARGRRVRRHSVSEPGRLAKLKANPDLQVLEQEGLNVGYLAMNVKKPPFDNVKVRQAINMAIDRKPS